MNSAPDLIEFLPSCCILSNGQRLRTDKYVRNMSEDDKYCQILWQHEVNHRWGSGLCPLCGEGSEKDGSDTRTCEQGAGGS